MLTTVDDSEDASPIFRLPDRPGKCLEIPGPPHIATETLCPVAQTGRQRLPGTIRIVVNSTAGPAGFAAVRLAEADEHFVRHAKPTLRSYIRKAHAFPSLSFPPVQEAIPLTVSRGLYEERHCRSRTKMISKDSIAEITGTRSICEAYVWENETG